MAPREWAPGLLMGEGVLRAPRVICSCTKCFLRLSWAPGQASPCSQAFWQGGRAKSPSKRVASELCLIEGEQCFVFWRQSPRKPFGIPPPHRAVLGPRGGRPALWSQPLYCEVKVYLFQLWVTGGPLLTAVVFLVSFAVFTFCSMLYYY